MPPLRVVIADDHPLVLEALQAALEQEDGVRVVGVAETGSLAVALVDRERPDVAVLDLHMPERDGIDCLAAIRERHPGVKVIILSASRSQADIDRALAAGAAAYVDKRVATRDIGALLRQVHAGTLTLPSAPPAERDGVLTSRERDVLDGLARGLSNKAIAAELWVTEQTVKFHLGNVYRKLGVTSRAEAQRLVYEAGPTGVR